MAAQSSFTGALARTLPVATIVLLGLATLIGSGGGGGDAAEALATVRIESPAPGAVLAGESVVVSGTAFMRSAAAYPSGDVYWSNTAAGASGTATGRVDCFITCFLNWTADIPLVPGANTIGVSYVDATDSVTVTRAVSVSGAITLDGSTGVPEVTVRADPSDRSSVTGEDGRYRIALLTAGNYTLVAEPWAAPRCTDCLHFTPVSRQVSVSGTVDVTGEDFVATVVSPSFAITGRVTASTDPDAGQAMLRMVISDAAGAEYVRYTDAGGYYAFRGFAPGTYTVTPQLFDAVFTPASRTVTIGSADVPDQDFVRQF